MVTRKEKYAKLSKQFFKWILASGGVVVLSILSPQLPYFLLKSYLRHRSRLKNRLNNWEKTGWIKVEYKKDKYIVRLVEKGRIHALEYDLENLKIKKQTDWDGRWRIVVFDIPDKKKLAREILRQKLKKLGFHPLQKSVFIYPYPCKKEIEIIKSAYEIWPYVNLIEAIKVDDAENLMEKFNL